MNSKTCLNCHTELQGNFCHLCGQKSSTHRITFVSFVKHDLPHGLFHLDKGILYTLKKIITSPARTAAEYLAGKRVHHYNIFALFIIVIALKAFIDSKSANDIVFSSADQNNADRDVNALLDNYYKVLYLFCIPIQSLLTFLFLKKLRYNFTEHIVLNCFLLTGAYFYALIVSLLDLILSSKYIGGFGIPVVAIYLGIALFKLARPHYKLVHISWRVPLILVLYAAILIGGFLLLLAVYYKDGFKGHIGPQ